MVGGVWVGQFAAGQGDLKDQNIYNYISIFNLKLYLLFLIDEVL